MKSVIIAFLGLGLGISIGFNVKLIDQLNIEQEPQSLTREDVVSIVDEALLLKERVQAKERLAILKEQYALASNDVTDKLLYGSEDARFTIELYSDIECPYCRKMHPGLKQVVDHSQGVINWEFKHYPLQIHNPAAAVFSQATECIADFHGNQIAWIAIEQFMKSTKGNGGSSIENIPELARSFGVNGSILNNCLASDDHKGSINDHFDQGRKLGITGTPAFYLRDNQNNRGMLVKGYKTPEQILAIINQVVNS